MAVVSDPLRNDSEVSAPRRSNWLASPLDRGWISKGSSKSYIESCLSGKSAAIPFNSGKVHNGSSKRYTK